MKGTYEAVCYSQAAQLLAVIPLLGSIVAPIWQIILLIIGLKEVHHISTGKSVLTVLIPFIVGCCLALLLIGGVLAFILMMVKSGQMTASLSTFSWSSAL